MSENSNFFNLTPPFLFWANFRARFCGRLKFAFALLAGFFAVQNAGAWGAVATLCSSGLFGSCGSHFSNNELTEDDAKTAALTACENFKREDETCQLQENSVFHNICRSTHTNTDRVLQNGNTDMTADDAKRAVCLMEPLFHPCNDLNGFPTRCDTTCEFGQERITAGGQRATDGFIYDCMPCGNNEISDKLTCTACAGDLVPNSAKDNCVCPDGMRLAGGQTETCVPETCGANEIRAANDACMACAGDLVPNSAKDNCVCPDGMRLAGGQTETCVPETCGANEIRAANDACMACGGDLVPNSAKDNCVCPADMELKPNETEMCQFSCASPMVPNTANDGCECPANMIPNPDNAADCVAPAECTGDLELKVATNTCGCPAGMELKTGETNMCELSCDSPMIPNAANDGCECPAEFDEVGGNCLTACGADEIRGGNNVCRAAQKEDCMETGEYPVISGGVLTCAPCPAGMVEHDNGLECRARTMDDCPPGMPLLENGECRARTAEDCPAETPFLDGQTCRVLTASDCEENEMFFDAGSGGVRFCAPPLPEYAAGYTRADCENEWRFTVAFLPGESVRETCEIPTVIKSNFTPETSELSGVRAQAVRAEEDGEYGACVLREHGGISGGRMIPRCDDAMLFGANGLPEMPDGFDTAVHRITVASSGVYFNGERLAQVAPPSAGGGGGSGGAKDNNRGEIIIAAGSAALVGLLVLGSWDGNPNAFSFSPRTSFSLNNKRMSYSYGSRLEFEQDELSAYWSATRAGAAENWLYAAGVKYGKDFWSANFDSINTGGETEIDLGISAAWKEGAWNWRSGINADYRTDGIENDFSAFWRNSMMLDYGNWQITPSAAFIWRGGEILGGGNFRIDLRREF